jgi:hypothetical protein
MRTTIPSHFGWIENWEIYEGVRFGFLNISGLSTGSFTITALRVVAQTLPVPYTGSFNCSDTLLTRSWYTGVYCPKLNMAGGFRQVFLRV